MNVQGIGVVSRRSVMKLGAVAALSPALMKFQGKAFAATQDAAPSLTIVSPADGDVVTGESIEVQVEVENFDVDGSRSGMADEDGIGHILAMVDGATIANLTGFYFDNSFSISGEGLDPGQHTINVLFASNAHNAMLDTVQSITIDYQPDNPVPLPEADYTGDPAAELVSPTDGSEVNAEFDIELTAVNFKPTYDLVGKPNVPGYGHWHVWVDTPMGTATPAPSDADATPAASASPLQGLVIMPGDNSFALDLSAWGAGDHTIFIEPAQNDHTTYENAGSVEFTVTVKESE